METSVERTKAMIVTRQLSADHPKQQGSVECVNCLGSLITNESCTSQGK